MIEDINPGQVVRVQGYCDPVNLFRCQSGFGMSAETLGQAIFGTWLSTGEEDRINRPDITEVVAEEAAKSEAWHKFRRFPEFKRTEIEIACYLDTAEKHYRNFCRGKLTKEQKDRVIHTLHREYSRLRYRLYEPNKKTIINRLIKERKERRSKQ